MKTFTRAGLAALALSTGALSAEAEPMKLEGTITDVIGHRLIVQGPNGKTIVSLGRKAKDQSALKSGDKITVEGDLRKDDELMADKITLSDGRTFETGKKQSWYEWMTGKKPAPEGAFTAAEAKTIAIGKGYALAADPVSEKKHFTTMASKDGKSYELNIHRDGNVEAKEAFGMAEAKKFAVDQGYTLSTDPTPEKKHFKAMATKGGKTFEIDIHRGGDIKENVSFNAADAAKAVANEGYQVVGEPKPEKKHFAMLAKKDEAYFEVHAHADGKVKKVRGVDKSDLTWGPMIQ